MQAETKAECLHNLGCTGFVFLVCSPMLSIVAYGMYFTEGLAAALTATILPFALLFLVLNLGRIWEWNHR